MTKTQKILMLIGAYNVCVFTHKVVTQAAKSAAKNLDKEIAKQKLKSV